MFGNYFICLLLVSCFVSNSLSSRVILESSYDVSYVPSDFSVVGSADSSSEISLHFAVHQNNREYLSELLDTVSDPRNSQYGNYITWNDIQVLVDNPTARQSITEWLETNDVTNWKVAGTGDWIVATMTVEQAELLLETSFSEIITTKGNSIIRALSPYSVPDFLSTHIDFIGGVHGFTGLISKSINTSGSSRVASPITPDVAKQQTFSSNTSGNSANNSMAVAQFLEQYYDPSDLSQFQSEYNLLVQPVTKVDGTNDVNSPGVEASLDIEYIMAMGQNIPTWFVSTSGRHEFQEPFLTWIQDMEAEPDAPWVHSVSYGDIESTISVDYAERCDVEFQKFGLTGRSILFASGDDGVGCASGSCSPNGDAVLSPNWPATSTYVTAVGGIVLEQNGDLVGDTISSGGFSNIFPQASYQSSAVNSYLANTTNIPTGETFNSTGRAVPDIAAFSSDVRIVYHGRDEGVGGTSCASPTAAGIFALLNDLRIQNGLPTLGFMNPFIYQTAESHPDAFTDVTSGQNSHSCCTGFKAAPGWDAITGWGLPNYSTLANYVLSN